VIDERTPAGVAVSPDVYRQLVESSHDLIWSVDAAGRWLFLNAACERIYGCAPAALIGRPFMERIVPEQRPIDVRVFERLLAGNPIVQHETRHLAADGRVIDLSFSAAPIRDAAGGVVGTLGTATDITARKQSARRQYETEWRFRRLVEVSPDAIIVKRDGRIVFVNAAADRLLDRGELIGVELMSIVAEGSRDRLATAIASVKGNSAQFSGVEVELAAGGGAPTHVEINGGHFLFDEVDAVLLVARDITARKAAERALVNERQYSELIINAAPLLICGFTAEGSTLFANPAVCRCTGYAESELIGVNWWRLFYPGDEYRQVDKLFDDFRAGPVANYVMTLTTKDGGKRRVSWNSINRRDSATGQELVIGLGSDVTEQQVLEAQLHQSQKMESIGQLAAGIAHEINTPTQFVGDNLRFLKDSLGALGPALATAEAACDGAAAEDLAYLRAEIPRAIEQSLEGISRVASIVRAMKEFSHPDLGDKQAIDINRVIETTITVARTEYKYVADLETDLRPLPPVFGYASEVSQTVLNLIVNAAHAIADVPGKPRGLIRIATLTDGDAIEIRIADTGTGIPESAWPRLFTPFFTTKPVGKGTGQGLFLAHTVVVRRHGGSIRFETEIGRGTVFIIRLPTAGAVGPEG